MKIQTQFPVSGFSGRMGKGNPMVAQIINGETIAREHRRASTIYSESYQQGKRFIAESAKFWKRGSASTFGKWEDYYQRRTSVQYYWFPRTTLFGFFQKINYYRQLSGGVPSFDIPDEYNISIGNLWNVINSPYCPDYLQLFFVSNIKYDSDHICFCQVGKFQSEQPYNSCHIYGGKRITCNYEFIESLSPKLNVFRVSIPIYDIPRFASRFAGLRFAICNPDGFMLFHCERSISYHKGVYKMLESIDLATEFVPYDWSLLDVENESGYIKFDSEKKCLHVHKTDNVNALSVRVPLPKKYFCWIKNLQLTYNVTSEKTNSCFSKLMYREYGAAPDEWQDASPLQETYLDEGDVFNLTQNLDVEALGSEFEFAWDLAFTAGSDVLDVDIYSVRWTTYKRLL